MTRSHNAGRARQDSGGTIEVDWVVLTAAIVGLGIAGVASLHPEVDETTSTLSDASGEVGAITTSFP